MTAIFKSELYDYTRTKISRAMLYYTYLEYPNLFRLLLYLLAQEATTPTPKGTHSSKLYS
jgi:hypothetical protein